MSSIRSPNNVSKKDSALKAKSRKGEYYETKV